MGYILKSFKCILKIRRLQKIVHYFILQGLILSSGCTKDKQPGYPAPTPLGNPYPATLKGYYLEPLDNPTTVEGVALGKAIFFDRNLSKDRTVSCATCHNPNLAFTDGLRTSKGINGIIGSRNAPGLFNIGLARKFFWDGRDTSLEQQSLHPIQAEGEMGLSLPEAEKRLQGIPSYATLFGKTFGTNTITYDRIAKALAQFERSLVSTQNKYDSFLVGLYEPTAQERLGMKLFQTHPSPTAGTTGLRGGNCGDCHLQPTLMGKLDGYEGFNNIGLETTFDGSQDIGLKRITGKEEDLGKFKVPSLRNVALTAPYMHDGRFATLEEVLDHYNREDLKYRPNVDPQIKVASNERFGESLLLTDEEKKAIIAFLHMLTDHSVGKR